MQAFPVESLAAELPKLLDGAEEILYVPGDDADLDHLVLSTMAHLRQAERRGMRAPRRIGDLRWTLHELRLIKDADALAKMRRAADVTRQAHTAAMRAARDGVKEYEIEALIDYTFRKHGGHPGYGTIVGGGVNATILHYVDNERAAARRASSCSSTPAARSTASPPTSRAPIPSARASRRRSGAATSWCSPSKKRASPRSSRATASTPSTSRRSSC